MFKQSNDDIIGQLWGFILPNDKTNMIWHGHYEGKTTRQNSGHLENFHHFILYNYRTPPDQFLVTQSKYCEIQYCSSYKKLQSKFTANYESSVTYITTIKRKQDTKIYIEYLTWKVWRNITVQRYSLQTILIKVNQSTDTEAHPD